jgi:hypothetical protein
MAAKTKAKKKQTKSKKPAKKKPAIKRKAPKKKAKKKKAAAKKAAVKKRVVAKKALRARKGKSSKKRGRGKSRSVKTEPFLTETPPRRSTVQSGDLQGLSDVEGAASESVDELLEEGNAFEADVVSGVEDADDSDEKEVHTHEVPEDDVPGEYLDED